MAEHLEILTTGADVHASGTSLMGNVKATYSELEAIFGEDMGECDGKVTAEFRAEILIREDDGDAFVSATIYDWKTGGTPYGPYEWHIGGFTTEAVHAVQSLVDRYRVENG